MRSSIRILIVEDREIDAEIMLRELRQAGFAPEWTRVQTEEAFRAHLRPPLDLILSDFELPRFTGRRALEILQERGLKIPFIVLSGTIGEDTAVEMMKQGATDYLLKDRLGRLGEAVRRALQEVQDREARERVESALRASDERFRKVFEYAPTGIAIGDASGRVQRCNPAYCALLGLSEAELRDTPLDQQVHADDRAAEKAEIERLRQAEVPYVQLHNRALRRDGTVMWLQKFVSLLHGKEGDPPYLLVLVTDITERWQAEAILRDAKAAAEAASLRKDLFIAMLSHELRTPLTPVLLTLSMLEERTDLPPDLRREIAMMEKNIGLEVTLINQLLDLSRISSGKMDLQPDTVDLNAAMVDVCALCKSELNERKQVLETDFDPHLAAIRADPARLRQVLWNVLANAIKFTPEGGTIRASTRQLPDRRAEVRIADNGIGFEPDMMPRLFEPFEQAEKRMTRQYGGLGLGLAISRALVEQHGGSITGESAGPGRGAVFTITLPGVKLPVAAEASPAPRAPGRGVALNLLIVEDHAATAQALRYVLAKSGHTVSVASSVADALQQAGKTTFDLVVSDIGLPDGDGYELMRRLRVLRPIPGIAISGFGMAEDIHRSHEAGFDLHLVKPVNGRKLRAAIEDLWQRLPAHRTERRQAKSIDN